MRIKTAKSGVWHAYCLCLAASSPALAEQHEPARGDDRFTLTAKLWQSGGDTSWNHNASALDPLLGDPSSQLRYQNVDSTVLEIRGRTLLPHRFFAELGVGAGNIDEGTLVDEDFLSAQGALAFGASVPGEHAFSSTISEIDGDDLHFFDLVLGLEVFRSRDHRSNLSLFGSYLDWSESYRAQGVLQTTCTVPNALCAPAGFTGFTGQDVIVNELRWRAVFLGVDGTHSFTSRFSVNARLSFSPLADLDNEDGHLLRTDLRQDPSFRMAGTGTAYSADLSASYRFSSRLAAHLGYRYWKMQVNDESGGWTSFPRNGPAFSAELNRFETERHGFTLGLSYRWGAGGDGGNESNAP